MKKYQITQWCHKFIEDHVQKGDVCIDATAGNGNDTLLLTKLVGEEGKVYAFDIQQQAIDTTRKKLQEAGMETRAELICDGHENMKNHIKEKVSCITFNFGYLPGGDHLLATKSKTSIKAIDDGLDMLKTGGMMSLCIYSGGDSGFEERDEILSHIRELDAKKYLVVVSQYYNRPNNPPIPAMIIRL